MGLFGYGVSLVLFVVAMRGLGSARAGAYFSAAPFLGAGFAVQSLHPPVSVSFWLAAALMAAGIWLHLTEDHEHEHLHEDLPHAHPHTHDLHHQHGHALPGTAPSHTSTNMTIRHCATVTHTIRICITGIGIERSLRRAVWTTISAYGAIAAYTTDIREIHNMNKKLQLTGLCPCLRAVAGRNRCVRRQYAAVEDEDLQRRMRPRKSLRGDDRKAYMKTCLSAKPAAAASTGNSQQQKMKTCNADATAQKLTGADRKTYMKTCLSAAPADAVFDVGTAAPPTSQRRHPTSGSRAVK